tara:strand:+ start:770 stop:2038 length:1269 start_codon:yes stop_codon:yes gene_type:complete
MIRIYSIQEIIDASEAILTKKDVEKKSVIDENSTLDKINVSIKSPMNIKEKKLSEQSIPEEINNIILEAEKSQVQKKINKFQEKSNSENKWTLEDPKVTKEEIVESMYLTFSKKIKKNTLKLIIDLREEIIYLTKNISLLRENKKQEDYSKRLLKKNVIDLKNIEHELNYKLKKTQDDLNILKENNDNLDLDHISLKEQNKNLIVEHSSLKNNFLNLRKILVELMSKTNLLKDNTTKINLQLNLYKDKEKESQSKIKQLEEEILIKNKFFDFANDNKNKIKFQLIEIDNYKKEVNELREKNQNLEKTIDTLRQNLSDNNKSENINDLENKIKYYQDENIRISSELVESNKRFSVTKESLSAIQNQRTDLIEKLNSINHVMKSENIISNVFDEGEDKFDNNQKPKKDMSSIDINKKIKDIFNR